MLEVAKLSPGDTILVHGIRGGVGTAVADLGRLHGLTVLGTSRSGGDGVSTFDRTAPDFEARLRARAPDGVSAVFDGSAGNVRESHRLVRRGGTLVIFGLSSASESSISSRLRFFRSLLTIARFSIFGGGKRTKVFAIDKMFRRDPGRVRALVAEQMALLAKRAIAPTVGAVLPLDQVARAHTLLERGAVVGKIVLTAGPSGAAAAA
jgi:NADPH2:quinone reductase